MKPNVEELVRGCQRHNPEAQRQLYEEFASMMLGVCSRYTSSRQEAQDLLHDGFVKVFENIGRLTTPHALEDWIYHIMINVSVNYARRHSNRLLPLPDDLDQLGSVDMSPLTAEEITNAISQLPDPYRLVFNLREVEGEEFATIAQQLNVAEPSVRSILSRAKKLLRDQLSK